MLMHPVKRLLSSPFWVYPLQIGFGELGNTQGIFGYLQQDTQLRIR
jgi:hypothetical protein